MSAVTIRHATIADLPHVVQIYNASIPGRLATADTEPIGVASRVDWFHAHAPERHPLLIAGQSGQPAEGWLSFQPFYGRPAYRATAELSVYVRPGFHRRGIASALMTEAIAMGPSLGITTLVAFVFGHNEPSLGLFRRFGFERWGYLARVAELDGVERDLEILGKRLDAAAGGRA